MAPSPATEALTSVEIETGVLRPTRALFGLVLTVAAILSLVPIYNNFLSPSAWRYTASLDSDVFDRLFIQMYMAAAGFGVLVAWLGAVYFQRRSIRGALRRCSPKGTSPAGLAEVAGVVQSQIQEEFESLKSAPLGPVHVLVNECTTESFVMGSGQRSWLVLSIGHLMLPVERLRFIVRHELAHLAMSDHRLIHWVPALLRGQILAYLICVFPFTLIGLFSGMQRIDSGGFVFEDIIFASISLLLLLISAEMLKQREIDADVSAAARGLGPQDVFRPEENRSWSASLRNLTASVLGFRYHPRPSSRLENLTSSGVYLAPWSYLPIFCGFLVALLGSWGFAVGELPSQGLAHPNAPQEFDQMIALLRFAPRALLTELCAAAVALDILRSKGPDFRPARAAWPATFRFLLGVALVVPFGILKSAIAGLDPLFAVASSIAAVEMNLFASVWLFGWSLFTILVACRWCLRAVPRGFPPRRLLVVTFAPAALFVLYRLLTWLWERSSGFDVYGYVWGPVLFALPIAMLAVVSWRLQGYEVCPSCGAKTPLKQWAQTVCSRCGGTWAEPLRRPSQWQNVVRRALPSVAGGAFGGAFFTIFPLIIAIDTLKAETLPNIYSGIVTTTLGLSLIGAAVGAASFAIVEFPRFQLFCALAFFGVATLMLVFAPPAFFSLYVPAGVLGGVALAERFHRSFSFIGTLRGRIAACMLCGIGLCLLTAWPVARLSAARGYEVGVARGAGVNGPQLSPALRETTRNIGDTILGTFLLAQGIVTFAAVFGKSHSPTCFLLTADADAFTI